MPWPQTYAPLGSLISTLLAEVNPVCAGIGRKHTDLILPGSDLEEGQILGDGARR